MNEQSAAQLRYLNRQKRHRLTVVLSRALILIGFFCLWEFCADRGIIDSFIFSSPSKIAACFMDMTRDGSIYRHIWVTLYETLVSFLLVIAISILMAVVLWLCPKLSEILDPYMVVLNSLILEEQPMTETDAELLLMTICHETYHAFQLAACSRPGKYGVSKSEAKIWRINFRDYITPEENPERYWIQPLETTARLFATRIVQAMREGEARP